MLIIMRFPQARLLRISFIGAFVYGPGAAANTAVIFIFYASPAKRFPPR